MVVLLVILCVVMFVTADLLIRLISNRIREAQEARRRREALDIGLKLDFREEAPSLKRVALDHPKAVILAVDDEPIVLDSFRKILVFAGYSIDTVESGPEALGLVRKNDYDFVFTDLRMPGMDGLEVTKAVHHLRPDIDIVMITGYATIESAVDAMKYGAVDHVQKPFTEDELVAFVDKSLIRRRDRIERQMRPRINIVTSPSQDAASDEVFNVPAGVFVAPGHTWLTIEKNGLARIGVDDFALKVIGPIDGIVLPESDRKLRRGEPLLTLRREGEEIRLPCPVSGRIRLVNESLKDHRELLKMKPYELGWICCIEPANFAEDLPSLRIGKDAEAWYQKEIERYRSLLKHTEQESAEASHAKDFWAELSTLFQAAPQMNASHAK